MSDKHEVHQEGPGSMAGDSAGGTLHGGSYPSVYSVQCIGAWGSCPWTQDWCDDWYIRDWSHEWMGSLDDWSGDWPWFDSSWNYWKEDWS